MASGLYQNAGEVVRETLRQMESREPAHEWLREETVAGFDPLERDEAVERDRHPS